MNKIIYKTLLIIVLMIILNLFFINKVNANVFVEMDVWSQENGSVGVMPHFFVDNDTITIDASKESELSLNVCITTPFILNNGYGIRVTLEEGDNLTNISVKEYEDDELSKASFKLSADLLKDGSGKLKIEAYVKVMGGEYVDIINLNIEIENKAANVSGTEVSVPGPEATAEEIFTYVKYIQENKGDDQKLIDKLLEVDGFGSLLNEWNKTVEKKIEKLETCIKNGKDENGKDATEDQQKGFIALKESYDEINKFILQAIQERANGNTSDEASGGTFFEGDETELENTFNTLNNLVNKVLGNSRTEGVFNDVFDDLSYYNPTNEPESNELTEKAGLILDIITNIGIVLSVVMPAIIGTKYMLGSVDEKAEYKKDMIPYVVGAFLLFGVCTIVKILQAIGQSINNI